MTLDDLYTLGPEEFVPARDALVRALKKTDPGAAATVKSLRRPTVVAWALNVVARAHPDAVEALLAAGERLRTAQEAALRGDATALRTATEGRRAAVAAVAGLVAEVLGDRAPAQAGAVSATLEAATVDEEVAGLLRAGRLDRERSAAAAGFGFGDVGDWTPPPPKPKPAKAATAAAAAEPEQAPAKKPAKPAKPVKPVKAAKAAKAAPQPKPDDTLERELAAATAEAKRAAGGLHDAEVRVRRLKDELAEATKAVRDARTKAQRAELQVEQLRQRAWEEGERRRPR